MAVKQAVSSMAGQRDVATRHVVVFKLGGNEYGLDIGYIREVLHLPEVSHIPHAPDFIEGVVTVRHHVVAVVDLRKRLGLPSMALSSKARLVITVVNHMVVGLLVEEVIDVLTLDGSSIEPTPAVIHRQVSDHCLTGVGRVGDRFIYLFNLAALFSPEDGVALRQPRPAGPGR